MKKEEELYNISGDDHLKNKTLFLKEKAKRENKSLGSGL